MADTDQMIEALEARALRRSDRREFFRTALSGAAVTGVALAASTSGLFYSDAALAQTAVTDSDILNFALNLEYLEAQFYSFAATGAGLPATSLSAIDGTGATVAGGTVTGGAKVTFTDPIVSAYAQEIAKDELAHVTFLRAQLGNVRVAQPAIDIGGTDPNGAFSKAAQAAGLVPAGTAFNPYANDENFLLAAYIFEDVGVSAYKGAASLLLNKTFVEATAGILAVEAYHAALIRGALYTKGLATPSLRTSADAISNARDSLDGTADLDQGISPAATPYGTGSNITPADANGLGIGRTTGQVLNIVYLNSAAVSLGGFFPAGVNGNIKTSAAN